MGLVLLYNIPAGDKLRRIRVALTRLGIPAREVSADEYSHPIGYLAGLEGYEPAADPGGDGFHAEMLVMSGLSPRQFNGLLDGLRSARATVTLKAVVTEHNAAWSSRELYRALQEEHDTMRELMEAKKKR